MRVKPSTIISMVSVARKRSFSIFSALRYITNTGPAAPPNSEPIAPPTTLNTAAIGVSQRRGMAGISPDE